jgi:hypothetical protein
MTARYALMNQGPDTVEHDVFARAFRGVPGFTSVDANRVGHPECGMLVRNLSLEQATALQSNLKAAGTDAEIVSQAALPVLPDGKVVRCLQCSPEVLEVRDCLQHSTGIGRKDVKLLAAGSVRIATFPRQRTEKQEVRADMIHIPFHPAPLMIPVMRSETRLQYVEREAEQWVLRAEIISPVVEQRFIIESENFDYSCLGPAMTHDLATNFCLLIRELAGKYSPPILSRGVTSILADPPEFSYYPNIDAFHNELVWLRWREASQSSTRPTEEETA